VAMCDAPMKPDSSDSDPEREEVRERLHAMEAKMRRLSDQRRAHNDTARAHADQRDAVQKQYADLREEIKVVLDEQKEIRNKAKVHQARRDALQEQLRSLFSRSKEAKDNRNKSAILQLSEKNSEAEKIEVRLERDGTLSLEAENKLHRKLKQLRSEIAALEPQVDEEMRIKIDIDDIEGSIEQLKAEADMEHQEMVNLHNEADKLWEGIKPKFEERDFLKSEGDRLHGLFKKSREEADNVHEQIEEFRAQVTAAKDELRAIHEERESWITMHNKEVDASTSRPEDDEELADSLVSNLMQSGALALGGATGLDQSGSGRGSRRKSRRTTAARRGRRGGSSQ